MTEIPDLKFPCVTGKTEYSTALVSCWCSLSGPVNTHTGIFKIKLFSLHFGLSYTRKQHFRSRKIELLENSFQGEDIQQLNFSVFTSGWAETDIFGNDDADKHVKRFVASLANVNKQTDDNTMMEKRDNSKTAQCFGGKLSKKTEGAVPFPSLIQCFL